MRWLAALLPLVPFCALAADNTAAALARSIREAGLDSRECYRIRDISFNREDLKFYLTDGYLIFGKPVNGKPVSAVFSSEVEGGDAEILLLPPHPSERLSLSSFAHTPNLNEHVTTAVFLFTDQSEVEFKKLIASSAAKPAPEMGLLLARKWDSVVRNLTLSFEVRLVQDQYLKDSASFGFFYGAVTGRTVGNFDLIFDPRAREQISVGQVVFRDNRSYFDVWTSFAARSWRNHRREYQVNGPNLSAMRIEASLNDDLHMTAVTTMQFTQTADIDSTLAFEVSPQVKVTEVLLDGSPVEAFTRDSLRANLLRGMENDLFLVIPGKPLGPGPHQIQFSHQGNVILSAGNGVYFVAARSSWYPNRGADFASYDLTFRYPRRLDLVATGEVVSDRTEGDTRITRRTTSSPIRFAGFNLGSYDKVSASHAGYTIEVVANKKIESALAAKHREPVVVPTPPPLFPRQPRRPTEGLPLPEFPAPNPTGRLQQIAAEVSSAVEFMARYFGPPPLQHLTVSPIPGGFGQGFPGLLYISTLSYLPPADRPATIRTGGMQLFFSEILYAHEVAHQWWGNLVTTSSYQDDWLMEALSNYSALMLLEKRKGRKAMDGVLDDYRAHLLAKEADRTVESAGPIVWGTRLNSSQSPAAFRVITYEKGSWIMHMLRARMGDDRFTGMLRGIVNRYRFKNFTTEQFHAIAREFMPPKTPDSRLDVFFAQWVYSTGIPKLKLSYTVHGKAPAVKVRGSLVQSGVDEDFSSAVPIEVQLPGKRSLTQWVITSGEPAAFSFDLKQPPVRVAVDVANTLAVH